MAGVSKSGWKVGIGMLAACAPVPAFAEDVPFSHTISDFCTIQIVENGVLAPSPNMRILRSRVADGGSPARLTVQSSSAGFTLSINPPAGFASQPAENTSPQTFNALMRSTGASVFSETTAPQSLSPGFSTVRVVLLAQKSASNVFPAGNYSAIVPVMCE